MSAPDNWTKAQADEIAGRGIASAHQAASPVRYGVAPTISNTSPGADPAGHADVVDAADEDACDA